MCQHCGNTNHDAEQIPLPFISSDELPTIPAPRVECEDCGAEIGEGEGYEIDGETYCGDCVCTCERCDTTHRTSDESVGTAYDPSNSASISRQSGQFVCDDCTFTCDDCNERFIDDSSNYENASGNRICCRCAEHYYTCESCDCVMHADDSFHHDASSRTLCRECHSEAEREEREAEEDSAPLHSYNYKPDAAFFRAVGEQGKQRDTLFLGWELETDHKQSRDCGDDIERTGLPDCIYCKNDGSLDNGFEMVSHPGTWNYWKSQSFEFMTKLRSMDYRSYDTTTCGMHVHVSKSVLSELDRLKLLEFVKGNRKFIKYISRRREELLERWANPDDSPRAGLIRKVKYGNDHDGRYTALNFENEHTVEFRIFRGTLDVKAFRRNLSFVVGLVHFVKDAGLDELTFQHFCKWLTLKGKGIIGKEDAKPLIKWVWGFGHNESTPEVEEATQCA